MELSRIQLRTIIYYEFCSNTGVTECHRNMCARLGEDIVSLSTVKRWYQNFKIKNFDIEDESRAGRPTVIDETELRKSIDEDQNATSRELASHFNVSQTTIIRALKNIGLTYKFNRWVPHDLTQNDKEKRKRTCVNLLEYHRKGDFLNRIVTCDEKWVYYDNTSRKGGWSEPGVPVRTVTRRTMTYKKILLCVFWDSRGIIYKEYLKSGQTIDSESYSSMLHKVDAAIREKRSKEFRRKVVMFHQDNARPHVSAWTNWNLYKLEWDLMPHPPYSPDMAPSDYYLFSHLQLHLSGEIFNSSEEVKKEVDLFLDSRSPEFFKEGIEKLPKRWQKIVELNGDYYPH